jgi:replicative DNA helicase
MDFERLLISKVAQTGRIQQLLTAGVRDDHFSEEENQEIFSFIAEHARRYKQAPSFQNVRDHFPDHNFEICDEAFDYLLDQFKIQVKRRHAINAVRDLADAIDQPEQVANIDTLFLEKSRELASLVPSAKLHKFSNMEDRILEYETSDGDDKTGIDMGIPALDNITLGIQPHEYVTVMGWTGTGKSTLAQWMLFNAWAKGKTPMLISLEMDAKALFRKWDTMLMNFEYHNLKSHELRDDDIAKWKERAKSVKDHPNDIIVMDDIREFTVDRAYAELIRWNPDILCIDYITLMSTSRSAGKQTWEKIQYLTNNLKQIARTTGIPIIGIAQTNRLSADAGAELDNVAFGMSIIQDSDMVLGLYRNDEMRENKQMTVKLLKNRDGMTQNTDLYWDMNTMDFRPWSEKFLFGGVKNDD